MKKLSLIIFIICLTACTAEKQTPEEKIQAYLDMAGEYFQQKNYDLINPELEKALQLSKKYFGEQSEETAHTYLKAALYSPLDEAMIKIQMAEVVLENSDDKGDLANIYYTYGRTYARSDKLELAKNAYEEALRYCDMGLTDMDVLKFDIYIRLAASTSSSDEEALTYYLDAETLLDKLPEEEKNKEKIRLYESLGNYYYELGQHQLAIESYEKVVECWIQYEEGDPLAVAQVYDHCGYRYAAVGNFDKSLEYINQSLIMLKDIESAELWDYAVAYRHLSIVYTANEIQDYEKFLKYGIKSCQIYMEQPELSTEELEELKLLKDSFKTSYENRPMAEQQDFESWYKENINRQSLKE